jgi:hypothetical protein
MRDLLGFIAMLIVLAIFCAYILWALWDARRRDKSPMVVLIAVTLFFPAGLVAWLLFRPNLPARE